MKETDLIDKLPLEGVGVRVEISELYETKLTKLGDTAVSCLGLEWWDNWNMVKVGDYVDGDDNNGGDISYMLVDGDDKPEGRVDRAPSPRF